MSHKQSSTLATAALMEIIARGQALQAAVIRGDDQTQVEASRQQIHDVLDAYLDHTQQAAEAVRRLATS